MILDNLHTTYCEYGNMGIKMAKAFTWLREHDLHDLTPDSTYKIDSGRIYAQVQNYMTIAPEETCFETHRSFIDIQVVTKGSELILWAPAAKLTAVNAAYNPNRDIALFEDPEHWVPLRLDVGDFAVFFPSDGHKPRCQIDGPAEVEKIVVKVSVQ